MRIVITGPKCCGKSTIGKILADNLSIPFVETDSLIEEIFHKRNGKKLSCRAIFSGLGENKFRELEKEAVLEVSKKDWCIISTGGSTMLNGTSRRLLRENSILVLLHASVPSLLKRLESLKTPTFLNNQSAKDMAARSQIITEVIEPYADIAVDTTSLKEDETIEQILDGLREEIAVRATNPNTFGQLIRLTTFGESHGSAIGAVLDDVQPGIAISEDEIQRELDRRKPGQSKLSSSRKEEDKIQILSGVFEGKTTGAPIGLMINNTNQNSSDYDNLRNIFRPGTADFTFWKKYGIRDHRGGGRASGRETAGRVMGGAIAKSILKGQGVNITAFTTAIANIHATQCNYKEIEKNAIRCPDAEAAIKMETAILQAKEEGDSVGGIVQIEITGVPAGLGNPVFGKLDARLGASILSIGGVKGVEFGSGFSVVVKKGSENNDEMQDGKFLTNNAGGILGGISTGEKIIIRAAVKPTPSISKKQKTIDVNGKNTTVSIKGRHDPCIIPRIIPVMESMVALTILDLWKIRHVMRQGAVRVAQRGSGFE